MSVSTVSKARIAQWILVSKLYLEPGHVYAYDDQIADTWEDTYDSKMTESYLSACEQFTAVLEKVVRPSSDCSTSIRCIRHECLENATLVSRTVLHL